MDLNKVLIKELDEKYAHNVKEVWEVNEDIRSYHKELFIVLMLNSDNRIIKREIVGIGTLDGCLIHLREVFREAIKANCKSIILVHNYPSGNPTPSDEDISITNKLVHAGEVLDIEVLDHVIITKNNYNSILNN